MRFDVNRPEDYQEIATISTAVTASWISWSITRAYGLITPNFGAPGGLNTTADVTPDVLKKTFETNFFAVVALTQVLLPLVRKARPAGS